MVCPPRPSSCVMIYFCFMMMIHQTESQKELRMMDVMITKRKRNQHYLSTFLLFTEVLNGVYGPSEGKDRTTDSLNSKKEDVINRSAQRPERIEGKSFRKAHYLYGSNDDNDADNDADNNDAVYYVSNTIINVGQQWRWWRIIISINTTNIYANATTTTTTTTTTTNDNTTNFYFERT